MTDGEALRQAVLANPEDDAPRLVYADWLDEHGDGDADGRRAAHLRLAIREGEPAAAAYWAAFAPPGWAGVAGRVRGVRPLPGGRLIVRPDPVYRHECHRGLLARLWGRLDDFLIDAPALFAEHPITAVRLVDRRPVALDSAWAWYVEDPAAHPPRPGPNWAGARLGPLLRGWAPVAGYPALRGYPTEAAALAALSDAAVAHGRAVAGLPDLRP